MFHSETKRLSKRQLIGREMQKCVLMITVPYYPSNASGVHRSVANAKYLPSFGWKPIVVCRRYSPDEHGTTYDPQLASIPDSCKVIRVDDVYNRVAKKIERLFWQFIGGRECDYRYPYLLYRRMRRVAELLVKEHKIDAIWATSLLGLDHRIADYLSRKYMIPWVADFRDLPDQSYTNRYTRYVVNQEINTCKTAKVIVASTEEQAIKLKSRHSVPIHTILNGYDPDEYDTIAAQMNQNNSEPKKFTMNHFGILYDFRDPTSLFAAIDLLSKNNKIDMNDIEINFYGASSKTVDNFKKGFQCAHRVQTLKRLSYHNMIECQKISQILLLVASPQQGGAIPAKVYGYLASRRPILNVPGDGAGTDRIVCQTKAGVSLSDPVEIAEWMYGAYQSWKNTGMIPYSGDESEILKYSRKSQTGQLATILNIVQHSDSL